MKRALTITLGLLLGAIASAVLAVLADPGSISEQLDRCETDYREAVL